MQIDPEESRQQFASLSDDALLDIERDQLVQLARQYYDEELKKRGLQYVPKVYEQADLDEPLVPAARFLFADEAYLARGLLRSGGVRCYLANEYTLSVFWPWSNLLGGLRLLVPASQVDEAREALATRVESDDHAEAPPDFDREVSQVASRRWGTRWTLAVFIFLFPSIDVSQLRIFYFF